MHRVRPLTIVITGVIALLAIGSFARSFETVPTPDFSAARDEVVKILTGFVRVDTSNPPGNVTFETRHGYVSRSGTGAGKVVSGSRDIADDVDRRN